MSQLVAGLQKAFPPVPLASSDHLPVPESRCCSRGAAGALPDCVGYLSRSAPGSSWQAEALCQSSGSTENPAEPQQAEQKLPSMAERLLQAPSLVG